MRDRHPAPAGSAAKPICHLKSVICNQAQRGGVATVVSSVGSAIKNAHCSKYPAKSLLGLATTASVVNALQIHTLCALCSLCQQEKTIAAIEHKTRKERTPTKPLPVNCYLHTERSGSTAVVGDARVSRNHLPSEICHLQSSAAWQAGCHVQSFVNPLDESARKSPQA